MKKTLSILLSLVMLLSIAAGMSFNVSATDASGSIGTNATYTFDSETGTLVISGTGGMSGYASLDSPFSNDSSIETVIIENGITDIGYGVFAGCDGLTSVMIPATVTFVNEFAFLSCDVLDNVFYEGSADDWNNGVEIKSNNKDLKNATLSVGCRYGSCGDKAYYLYSDTTNALEIAGKGAMNDCMNYDAQPYGTFRDSVYNIFIDEGITAIGAYAFSQFTNAVRADIPATLTSIGDYAFENCTHLTNVYYGGLPKQFESISIGSGNMILTDDAYIFSSGERLFKVTYDFNGGTKDGAGTYVSYQVAYAPNISAENFIDSMSVIPPEGMTLDAIEVNGSRYELGSGYMLNQNTAYKYLWKGHPHNYVTKIVKASPNDHGSITEECSVCGDVKSEKEITMPHVIVLSKEDYAYDGKAKKPKVTVKDLNGKTIAKSNYTVTYAKGRKKIGAYKVTVKFKGKYYKGTMKKKFRINPKGTSITKLVSTKKNQFKVSWKKRTKNCSGYQIIYSTNPKFGIFYSPYPTVKGYKNTSKEIENIPENGKFYVKVRTYKTVKGKKYYSTWSKAKSVIVK
ncbi:MAG: leucine-rich repeat domain-containing protein [Eubacterium sp.]|nr:leucine-rich repeat domain-containing protein [Eubacterium sp.]